MLKLEADLSEENIKCYMIYHSNKFVTEKAQRRHAIKDIISEAVSDVADKLPGALEEVDCPSRGCSELVYDDERTLYGVIIHLNDKHKWKRERIADWMDTLDIDMQFHV